MVGSVWVVGVAHGHEEDGCVEVRETQGAGGPAQGGEEVLEGGEEMAGEEEGLLGEGEGVEVGEGEGEVDGGEEEEGEAAAVKADVGGQGAREIRE